MEADKSYLDTTGRIFDIQRYSIHDGVGIRTIVFLKGCVLRCRWCCNPESQGYEVETMLVHGKEKVMGEDKSVAQVLEIVEKDRNYYRRSGGGLTLSGGECLCQPEFARDLLRGAKSIGINTAIESTACVPFTIIETILPYLDHFLMDIKHISGKKHQEYTGKSNEIILENAKKIADSKMTKLSIRVPVVPGFNDTIDEIKEIARFTEKLSGVEEIYLLPYHRLGQDKYEGLNREYLMKEILPPDLNHMEQLKLAVEQVSTVRCQIGG